ncbi:hypothetical protein QTP88_011777 [Uroleucon formosanum]
MPKITELHHILIWSTALLSREIVVLRKLTRPLPVTFEEREFDILFWVLAFVASDAYIIDRQSTADAMLKVFDDLRTNRPKSLPSRSLESSRLNRGVSRSMPNMAILQGTPTAPMELLYVSSANSSTLNMESVETVELPAASPTIVVANYANPAFRYYIGLFNVAMLKPTVAEVCGIESISSTPMPTEVKLVKADALQESSEIGSPPARCPT